MWLCVDRIEKSTVVLTDDDERVYRMSVERYVTAVGRPPKEADVLAAVTEEGVILSAVFDPDETDARAKAAHARLDRLLGRRQS